jgi:signal peptidase I
MNIKVIRKVSAWAIIATLVGAPALLHSQAGIGISPILTGSMRPYAQPGDIFITKNVKASSLKVGQIIAVHAAKTGVFYSHRIAEITMLGSQLRIVTKGDANPVAEHDPFLVGGNEMVSKSIGRVKYLGFALVWLTSVQGRQAGLAAIVFANVLALFLFLFKKEQKKNKKEAIYRALYEEQRLASDPEKSDHSFTFQDS